MVEAIGMEVFGTGSLSTFEYICAYAFIFYPLVSLPLLVHYWLKASQKSANNSIMGFETPFALKKKQETSFVSPLETSDTSETISSTGRHNITFIGRRNKKTDPKTLPKGLNSNVLKLVKTARVKPDSSGDLLSAARKVALSSESTAELRAVALDFLISSQSRDRLYKQKNSFHEVSDSFENSASSF